MGTADRKIATASPVSACSAGSSGRAIAGDVSKGMDFIMDETEKDKPVKYKSDKADLYAWYYHTQAALMYGGRRVAKVEPLVPGRNCRRAKSRWELAGAGWQRSRPGDEKSGAVYRTTLCILMLEVFYRYIAVERGDLREFYKFLRAFANQQTPVVFGGIKQARKRDCVGF
jgi:hypothetical protein